RTMPTWVPARPIVFSFPLVIQLPLTFAHFPYTTLFRSPNSSIYSDEKSRVLVDKTKSGKVRPWREKKIANVDYFELLHILEFKKAERVKDCAEILEYKQNRETGERKLYRVWFCKSR